MTFSEILKAHPIKWRNNNQRFLFEFKNGDEAELTCSKCGHNLWNIGVMNEKKRLAFRIFCLMCSQDFFYLWMEPKQLNAKKI